MRWTFSRGQPREAAALAVCLVAYLFLSWISFDQIEEDAFIYLRCAENLGAGRGYVFNAEGPRVEAASSLAWLGLLGLLSLLPLELMLSAKLLGVLCGSGCLVLVFSIAKRLDLEFPWSIAPTLLTLSSVPFVMWGQRGLETPLYALAVLWLVRCCVEPRLRGHWVAPALFLLIARAEGFFVLLALIPILLARGGAARGLGREVATFSLGALLLTVMRFAYFHDLLPNPFYVKFGAEVIQGPNPLHGYLLQSYAYLLLVPIGLALSRRSFRDRRRLALASFTILLSAWCVMAEDYMPYFRHLVPAIPLLLLLATSALAELTRDRPLAHWASLLALAGLAIASCFVLETTGHFNRSIPNPIGVELGRFASDPGRFVERFGAAFRDPRTKLAPNFQARIGTYIRNRYPGDATVVYDQMGRSAYQAGSELNFIDSLGLTDPTIAHYSFTQRSRESWALRSYYSVFVALRSAVFPDDPLLHRQEEVLDYVFATDPVAIILNRGFLFGLDPTSTRRILLDDPRFRARYRVEASAPRIAVVYERSAS